MASYGCRCDQCRETKLPKKHPKRLKPSLNQKKHFSNGYENTKKDNGDLSGLLLFLRSGEVFEVEGLYDYAAFKVSIKGLTLNNKFR